MRFPLPLGGAHDGQPFVDQPVGTSRQLVNMSPVDPATGRFRMSQRHGHSKYCSVVSGGAKARNIQSVVSNNARLTFTSLGDSVTTDSALATPQVADCKNIKTDRQGNQYALNGKSGIVKYNAARVQVATLELPVSDPLHEVRALAVSQVDGKVFAAVSTGGDVNKVRMWCYQFDGDTPELVWQMPLERYVEEIVLQNDYLYTAQNDTDTQKSYVVGYSGASVANPTEVFVRDGCSYPINALAISSKDGSLYVASEPNTTRGFNPLSPDTTAVSEDWTPRNLSNYGKRVRAWFDASDPLAFLVTPIVNSDDLEGGEITVWYDKSGHGRHWYADATGAGTHTGPTLRTNGVAGKPVAHFNGASNSMISLPSQSTERGADGLSVLPTYSGAQFVVMMVVRLSTSSSARYVLAQEGTNSTPAARTRAIIANAAPTGTIGSDPSENEVILFEVDGVASAVPPTTTAATAPAGSGTTPLGGAIGPGGLCVLTWLCDGGAQDVATSATRSLWRVNGHPCDRWQSADFTSTTGTKLGFSATGALGLLSGDVCEIIVLEGWRDSTDAVQRLILDNASGQPLDTRFPDITFSFSSSVTNDVLLTEGYLAHKWGGGHLLPAGQAAWLRDVAGAVPNNNDTATVGGQTYTFKTALTPTANEVLRGATGEIALRNLRRAINGEGTPGVDYASSTVPNTAFRAQGPIGYQNSSPPRMALLVRSINQSAAASALAENTGGARLDWSTTTINSVLTADSFSTIPVPVSKNTQWYPHQYATTKIASRTLGGPPRSEDALTSPSRYGLFASSPYGILAKIDSSNGKLKWIATSAWDGSTTGIGGVGYGVIVGNDGKSIYSMGPREASANVTADPIDIRKFYDAGDSFVNTPGTTAVTAWNDNPGALTYAYPRMAVDKYDNVYCPIHSAGSESLIVYQRLGDGTGGGDSAIEISTVTNITGTPNAYAVALNPEYPEYTSSFTNTRAQHVYLATVKTGASNFATYKLGLISTAAAAGSFRTQTLLVVNGGDLNVFTTGSVTTPTGGAACFDSSAQFVDSAVHRGKARYTDGGAKLPKVYDPVTNTVTDWTATDGGNIPPRFKLIATWAGRTVVARCDNPSQWAMSEINEPDHWDFFPAVPTYSTAVSGTTSLAGQPSDIINAIVPIGDDLLIFGGDHSIRRLVGNPAVPSSQIQLITDTIGMSFGPSWSRDAQGFVYFHSSRGGVYVMGGDGSGLRSLTEGRIQRRFESIDLANYYVELEFNDRDQVLHVFVVPYGAGGTIVAHYRWHKPTNSWWPDRFSLAGVQPTCAYMLDGDTEADRILLIGCEDGYIRKISETAKTDDGNVIATECLCGPLVPDSEEMMGRTTNLQALLANDQGGCNYELYASDTGDVLGAPILFGALAPGRNRVPAGMSAAAIWLMLRGASTVERYSIESVHMDMHEAGRK